MNPENARKQERIASRIMGMNSLRDISDQGRPNQRARRVSAVRALVHAGSHLPRQTHCEEAELCCASSGDRRGVGFVIQIVQSSCRPLFLVPFNYLFSLSTYARLQWLTHKPDVTC